MSYPTEANAPPSNPLTAVTFHPLQPDQPDLIGQLNQYLCIHPISPVDQGSGLQVDLDQAYLYPGLEAVIRPEVEAWFCPPGVSPPPDLPTWVDVSTRLAKATLGPQHCLIAATPDGGQHVCLFLVLFMIRRGSSYEVIDLLTGQTRPDT